MTQDFFTIADVAKKLQLHAKTVLNFVHEGRLKAMRIGKQYRISPSDLRAFMHGSVPMPTGEVRHVRFIESSSVLNIDGVSAAQAERIRIHFESACAALALRDPHARVDAIHNAELMRLKLIVSGSLETTVYLLGLVQTYLRL